MRASRIPTQARVRELFDFNKMTGEFCRKIRTANSVSVGDRADRNGPSGYLVCAVDGVAVMAHRLAWLHVYGEWPSAVGYDIDHVDGNKKNNAIGNLRVATRSQNNINSATHKSNTSGVRGVSWCKRTGRWQAHVHIGKKAVFLGRFYDLREAAQVRVDAVKREYGAYSRRQVDEICN